MIAMKKRSLSYVFLYVGAFVVAISMFNPIDEPGLVNIGILFVSIGILLALVKPKVKL